MARIRQLDPAGPARAGWTLIRWLAVVLLLSSISLPCSGRTLAGASKTEEIRQLFDQEHWQDVVRLVEDMSAPTADDIYFHAVALAKLGRWSQAQQVFLQGQQLQPQDKRFPIELAGVAFQQKSYPEAARWLHRALDLDPGDAYANDFLGSVYFLQDNLEAALKYWNRVDKPRIESIRYEPKPRVSAALLDRAFAFSPASTLRLPDLLTTETRVRGLEIFPRYAFQLTASEQGKFEVIFRARERNGWGNTKREGLLLLFRGVFQQTLHPELFNLGQSATNVVSLARWDTQKRRLYASLSGPVRQDAKWRYRVGVDLRNENWEMRDFLTPAPLLGALNLRKEAVSAGITCFVSGRWNWSTGVEFSHRDFRGVILGPIQTEAPLPQGYQLKHLAQLYYELWRVPERRFVATSYLSSEVGRTWSKPGHIFAKLQGSLSGHWFPLSRGDDYETQGRILGGRTFGKVPFDELFLLGVKGDSGLWLRAHRGTHAGRKGNSPLGRNYVLTNLEMDKNVYRKSFFRLQMGPFVDTGKVTDPFLPLASNKWLWDTGIQAKLNVLGFGITVAYGKDLRTGNNIVYAMTGR